MKKLTELLEEIITPEDCLGIKREDMPQIDSEHVSEFLEYLKNGRCNYEEVKLAAESLHPSQSELDTDKADDMFKDKECLEIPIFVSEDNYVLDGHHRWLAMSRNQPEGLLNCIRMKKGAQECLELMHGFSKTSKRDIEDEKVEESFDDSDLEIVADILSNDEESSDKEIIDNILDNTELSADEAKKIVKRERANFLRGKYLQSRTKDLVKMLAKVIGEDFKSETLSVSVLKKYGVTETRAGGQLKYDGAHMLFKSANGVRVQIDIPKEKMALLAKEKDVNVMVDVKEK